MASESAPGTSEKKAGSVPYSRNTCRSSSLKAAFVIAPQNHLTCGASLSSHTAVHGGWLLLAVTVLAVMALAVMVLAVSAQPVH